MSRQARGDGAQLLEHIAGCEHDVGRKLETGRESEWCAFCGAVKLPGSSTWILPVAARRAQQLEGT